MHDNPWVIDGLWVEPGVVSVLPTSGVLTMFSRIRSPEWAGSTALKGRVIIIAQ